MELQKTFKPTYCSALRARAKEGLHLYEYREKTFPIDDSQVTKLADVYHPDGLLDELIPEQKYDFENAVKIYKAYENLSPLIASMESFWAYLTHVDLFPFVQKRCSNILKQEIKETNILEHWFMGNGITNKMGNAIAGLWWCVKLSVDNSVKGEERFDLTKILFSKSDIRQNLSTSTTLFPNNEAVIGILQAFKEHPELLQGNVSDRNRFIIQSFNRLGGVKQLSYMDRTFYKEEIEKNIDSILSVKYIKDKGFDKIWK